MITRFFHQRTNHLTFLLLVLPSPSLHHLPSPVSLDNPNPVASPSSSPPSAEGRPLPDGALHAAAGAHHVDQRQRAGRGRLLLPALHGRHPPPGGHAVRVRAAGDAHGGREAGGRGGRRGRAHLHDAAQQAGRLPALDAQRPGDTRYVRYIRVRLTDGLMDARKITINETKLMKG